MHINFFFFFYRNSHLYTIFFSCVFDASGYQLRNTTTKFTQYRHKTTSENRISGESMKQGTTHAHKKKMVFNDVEFFSLE